MNWRHALLRGLLLRCPNCGQPHLYRQWLRMVDRCPRCGLHFEREEGYWTGAVAINTVATEVVFIALLAVVVIWTWPDVPMVPVLIGALVLNGLFPLIFYPFSKTIWVAVDRALLQHLDKNESLDEQMRRERH